MTLETFCDFQETCEEQRKALSEMEHRIVELESVRIKQSRKIASLKQDKDLTETEAQQGFRVTESAVQSLSNEVQRLKSRLDEVQKREKQVQKGLLVVHTKLFSIFSNKSFFS